VDFSELLTPDDIAGKVTVGVFGPAVAVIAIVVLAKVVESTLRVVPGGRVRSDAAASGGSAYRTLMGTRPVAMVVGSVVTVLLALAQTAWLWSASRVAHGLSYLWHAPFGNARVNLSGLTSHGRWDWISASYLLASVVALLASYVSAFRSGERDVIGGSTIVLALPLILPWGLFSLVGSLFALVMAGIRSLSDDPQRLTEDGGPFFVVTLMVFLYAVALYLALGATRSIAAYWGRKAW